jgi:hypothetical protein
MSLAPLLPSPPPVKVFIVPYRDREKDKEEFLKNMSRLLEDTQKSEPYEIYFAHQYDARPFNRGAMKNIGFLAVKDKYPDAYKNITFIFHDVDTWAVEKGLIDYNTTAGVVKHYYGFKFALGGMFAIKGADFEKSRGFPNFWGWGIEDNVMNDRCLAAGLTIDRSCFYHINDARIFRTFDGFSRIISQKDSLVYKTATTDDMNALREVKWRLIAAANAAANANANACIFMINAYNFECAMNYKEQIYKPIDIRKTKKLIVPKASQFRRNWSILGALPPHPPF